MYVKRSFAMTDAEAAELLARVETADLVSNSANGLVATLMPFVWDPARGEQGALLTHMMRVNTQWRDTVGDVLVIANGLDHYVSAEWLPAGAQVPTWNYETVHVTGELVVHDDIAWCRDVVARTVERHEGTWRVDPDDPGIDRMLRGVVGVEVLVKRIEAKAKLSQNKHPDVIEGIIAGLEAKGLHADAEALRRQSLPVARERQALVDAAGARRPGRA